MDRRGHKLLKITIFMAVFLIIFGCAKKAENDETGTQTETIKEFDSSDSLGRIKADGAGDSNFGSFAVSSGDALYIRTDRGIEKIEKGSKKAKLIHKSSEADMLLVSDGIVYFSEKDSVFRINGDKAEKIFDRHSVKDAADFGDIEDFAVSGMRLYAKSGSYLAEFRHDIRTVTKVYENIGLFAVKGNEMIYTTADRNDIIRHMRVDTGEKTEGVIALSEPFDALYDFDGGFAFKTERGGLYCISRWYALVNSFNLPQNAEELKVLSYGARLFAAVKTSGGVSLYSLDENGSASLVLEGINAASAADCALAGDTLYYLSRASGRVEKAQLKN